MIASFICTLDKADMDIRSLSLMKLPDGQMVDQWEPVSRDSVKTPLEVYEELQVEGYLVDYERVPVTDEKSPKELDFDILITFLQEGWISSLCMVHKISQANINTEIIFNCQMGRGRTTTGMVIATLVYLNRIGASGMPRSDSIGKVFDSGTNVSDHLPNSEEAIRRGEYAAIRSLIRVLEGGVEGKRQVDKVIDKCASMQNLREAIATYRNSILRQRDEMKREALLSFFVEYLERYYFLICFAVYIHTDRAALHPDSFGRSSFADWMRARPELYSIIRRVSLRNGALLGKWLQIFPRIMTLPDQLLTFLSQQHSHLGTSGGRWAERDRSTARGSFRVGEAGRKKKGGERIMAKVFPVGTRGKRGQEVGNSWFLPPSLPSLNSKKLNIGQVGTKKAGVARAGGDEAFSDENGQAFERKAQSLPNPSLLTVAKVGCNLKGPSWGKLYQYPDDQMRGSAKKEVKFSSKKLWTTLFPPSFDRRQGLRSRSEPLLHGKPSSDSEEFPKEEAFGAGSQLERGFSASPLIYCQSSRIQKRCSGEGTCCQKAKWLCANPILKKTKKDFRAEWGPIFVVHQSRFCLLIQKSEEEEQMLHWYVRPVGTGSEETKKVECDRRFVGSVWTVRNKEWAALPACEASDLYGCPQFMAQTVPYLGRIFGWSF
ncbi:Paladin [Vitis vinifera]|uniref:Paladin n=1 Tax=Vitis vinifera TaxID=29760 RepID=A0A438BNI2_VITVI|nr:Paladin [Vitis vinifera]